MFFWGDCPCCETGTGTGTGTGTVTDCCDGASIPDRLFMVMDLYENRTIGGVCEDLYATHNFILVLDDATSIWESDFQNITWEVAGGSNGPYSVKVDFRCIGVGAGCSPTLFECRMFRDDCGSTVCINWDPAIGGSCTCDPVHFETGCISGSNSSCWDDPATSVCGTGAFSPRKHTIDE